ncbi:hypothetical protein RRG08_050057 [Elysia crispata]|uniref:Uncharacterized protein n=1 Tax=Elysia crispata TaxID=231223 RepID=A0AAE1EC76_9GAST|nr:hypothetical protein RRG08_050057 [Elysia crispata]
MARECPVSQWLALSAVSGIARPTPPGVSAGRGSDSQRSALRPPASRDQWTQRAAQENAGVHYWENT